MTGNLIVLLSFTAFLLAFCNGEKFYVRSTDNETSCPPTAAPTNCRLISEYAANSSSFNGTDDGHVDIVFLPGLHTLHTDLFIVGVANLALRPLEPERNTTITCDKTGNFNLSLSSQHSVIKLALIVLVEIRSLEFRSCSTDFKDPIIFVDIFMEVIVENCTFTNNSIPTMYSFLSSLAFIG